MNNHFGPDYKFDFTDGLELEPVLPGVGSPDTLSIDSATINLLADPAGERNDFANRVRAYEDAFSVPDKFVDSQTGKSIYGVRLNDTAENLARYGGYHVRFQTFMAHTQNRLDAHPDMVEAAMNPDIPTLVV
ncbi:MAG: hypothetical protein R3313_03585, partial [Candidatus Saccharimonadales bacterium]|nr:hypothetical protein [Candidatus Saccharimonadales bacterium]